MEADRAIIPIKNAPLQIHVTQLCDNQGETAFVTFTPPRSAVCFDAPRPSPRVLLSSHQPPHIRHTSQAASTHQRIASTPVTRCS